MGSERITADEGMNERGLQSRLELVSRFKASVYAIYGQSCCSYLKLNFLSIHAKLVMVKFLIDRDRWLVAYLISPRSCFEVDQVD